jgi:hypothetical protein
MAEGLDPVEVGRELHRHAHDHDGERGEEPETKELKGKRGADDRHSRRLQLAEALLLALVTVTAAWAGYAAAEWNTVSRVDIARAALLHDLATRAELRALSERNFDSSSFNAWFIAYTLHSPQREAIAERRFRPVFRTAFRAWLATDPLHNPHAPPGPTYMPQYKLADQARGDALDATAEEKFQEGSHDGLVSDDYIRITVFLAAVLFLVGIGSMFKLTNARYALVGVGTGMLVLAVVLILLQPGLPG